MIGSSENRVSYDGNGIATEFAYTFKILEKTDLKVLHVATDGTETLLVSDYYVDMEKSVVLYPGYAPGAEIPEQNRPPILPVGERLVLYREVPITQESALDKHWPFNVIENGLDKLTIICQQIWDRLQRSFYVSESTSTNFDPKVPIEAGKTFRVKDDGTGFEVTEDPGKVIDGATALLKQTTEQAEFAKEQADASSQSAVNAQNAANTAEKIATDLGLVDEAVQTAVSSAEQASNSATTASNKADVATTQADIATTKASEASTSADTATQKADAASTSATNAAQSYANADAIATQLTEYLATKESLTAPAVDKTLLIEGAAADSKVVGELKGDLTDLDSRLSESIVELGVTVDDTWKMLNDGTVTKSVTYTNNSISSATGKDETHSDIRAASEYIYTPKGATVGVDMNSGYAVMSRFWYDASKEFLAVNVSKPENAAYFRFVGYKADSSTITPEEAQQNFTVIVRIAKGLDDKISEIASAIADTKISGVLSDAVKKVVGKNKADTSKSVGGFLNADGSVYTNVSYETTDYIDISAFEKKVAISPKIRKYLEFDANKRPIADSFVDGQMTNATITPHANAVYCRATYWVTDKDSFMVEDGDTVTQYAPYSVVIEEPIGLNEMQKNEVLGIAKSGVLSGKVGLTFGDSIMYGAGNGGIGILDILVEEYGVTGRDFAVSGASCAYHEDISHIVAQIQSALTAGITPDFILIDGLSNDIVKSAKGSISASFDYASAGYATFASGLEYCFGLLRDNFPTVPIIYVIPHASNARVYADELAFGEMARDICAKWSVPIADVYKDGNMTARVSGQLQAFTFYPTEETGTHPNRAGYDFSYIPLIVDKLQRAMN